jgi:hypothetical protein
VSSPKFALIAIRISDIGFFQDKKKSTRKHSWQFLFYSLSSSAFPARVSTAYSQCTGQSGGGIFFPATEHGFTLSDA